MQEMITALEQNRALDERQFDNDVYQKVELPFTKIRDSKPTPVSTDLSSLCAQIVYEVSHTLKKLDEKVEDLTLPVYVHEVDGEW